MKAGVLLVAVVACVTFKLALANHEYRVRIKNPVGIQYFNLSQIFEDYEVLNRIITPLWAGVEESSTDETPSIVTTTAASPKLREVAMQKMVAKFKIKLNQINKSVKILQTNQEDGLKRVFKKIGIDFDNSTSGLNSYAKSRFVTGLRAEIPNEYEFYSLIEHEH